ncbi:hypothetical protein M5F04_01460, partial [Acinetobacter sp. ANC 7200]|uniref:hypothetical protein n=1 Tax=Acinetobacter amyesii TaxID=2942470 RepID=UPI0020BF807E
MKEMLLWVKRTRIRNDGREQWYATSMERPWVCEIGETQQLSASGEISSFDYHTIAQTNYDGIIDTIESSKKYETVDSYTAQLINYYTIGRNFSKAIITQGIIPKNNANGFVRISGFIEQQGESETEITALTASQSFIEFGYTETISSSGANYRKKYTISGLAKLMPDQELSISIELKGGALAALSFSINVLVDSPKLNDTTRLDAYDINPIHKIREILTDDTAMNKPESDVNDINFMKAADRIWDEGLGISWSITEKACLEAIEELCGHIEAGVRINRQTGLYEVVLFRDDWFEESEIHSITVNKIKNMQLDPPVFTDELINKLNVSFYNRDAIKDSSFSVSENAAIRNLGGVEVPGDADFPYFMNQRNATVVAQWKLKQMSSPVWKGSFTTAEYNARKWNRYDLLKLAWPRKWQGEITVRIMKINLGTGADVSIDFVEVVPYSSHLWSDVVIDEPIDVGVQPPLACPYEPFEMPYYLAVMALGQRQVNEELNYENNFGLVGVVAQQPQSNSLYAVMMTHNGVEGEEWLRAATINYEPVAELDQIISRTLTNFTVKDSAAISGLPIGTLIKCGSDWIGTPGEWMVFIGIDPYTGVVSVKRGALDSLPQDWGIGTKLYFCGNDVAYDSTEYIAGEEVLVSALTTTPSGMLENKGSIAIEMNARAFRPYPPANVKINGEYWPEEIETDLVITWVDRNRIQQTGGEILGWFDGGVSSELGVQTHLILTEYDENQIELATNNVNVTASNTYTLPISSMQAATKTVEITLKTIRDGYECLQPFEHIIELSLFFSAPYNITHIVTDI